jgi:hypothetical protein
VFTNDCLLRHLHRYANLAIVDLDELITPRGNEEKSLLKLIEALDRRHTDASDYSFANHFFFTGMQGLEANATDLQGARLPLDMLTATLRHEPFLHGNRSKSILKPDRVVVASTHHVTEVVPGEVPWQRLHMLAAPWVKAFDDERCTDDVSSHSLLCTHRDIDRERADECGGAVSLPGGE